MIQVVYDCIRVNIGRAPAGLLAGYTTGSSDIRWQESDWAKHPGAIRIDQDAAASDHTADVLDVETGAASPDDVPDWARSARQSYASAARPGQRSPLIYMNGSTVTSVCNALLRAGLADGSVGLFIANWNLNQAEAVTQVLAAAGPFPVRGIQFKDAGAFDIDIFDVGWLNDISKKGAPTVDAHPGQGGPSVWGFHAFGLKTTRATVGWQHTGGVTGWQYHVSGPGLNRTGNLTVPQASFEGLHRGQVYELSVVSLVGGHQAGVVGKTSFRTALA